jgi:hypothetical protein
MPYSFVLDALDKKDFSILEFERYRHILQKEISCNHSVFKSLQIIRLKVIALRRKTRFSVTVDHLDLAQVNIENLIDRIKTKNIPGIQMSMSLLLQNFNDILRHEDECIRLLESKRHLVTTQTNIDEVKNRINRKKIYAQFVLRVSAQYKKVEEQIVTCYLPN